MALHKTAPNSRGYYVKMKLLHKHGRSHHQQEKNCFYKYYKWLLWLSLSLYFFTSYLISNNNHTKQPPPHKTTHVSRTLIESNNTAPPQSLHYLGIYTQSHFILQYVKKNIIFKLKIRNLVLFDVLLYKGLRR